jgi:hypothetical protein
VSQTSVRTQSVSQTSVRTQSVSQTSVRIIMFQNLHQSQQTYWKEKKMKLERVESLEKTFTCNDSVFQNRDGLRALCKASDMPSLSNLHVVILS